MKKKNLMNFMEEMEKVIKRKSPGILTGIAVVGVLATGYMAYKAGGKAEKILKEKKKDLKDVAPGDTKAKNAVIAETAKELAPVVLPPVIMGAATISCIVGSNTVSSRRIAALSAAYTISESAVKDLNGKMAEMLGEKKTKQIKEAIAGDKFKADGAATPVEQDIIITGGGDVLCKDLYSGRYFRSNAQRIGEVINRLSNDLQQDMFVSLNDLYDYLGLPTIPMGAQLGFSVDCLVHGQVPITISAQLTEEKMPCLCIDYDAVIDRETFKVW